MRHEGDYPSKNLENRVRQINPLAGRTQEYCVSPAKKSLQVLHLLALGLGQRDRTFCSGSHMTRL